MQCRPQHFCQGQMFPPKFNPDHMTWTIDRAEIRLFLPNQPLAKANPTAGDITKGDALSGKTASSVIHAVPVETNIPQHNVNDSNKIFSGDLYTLGKTPINLEALSYYLKFYPNQDVAKMLYHGFKNGFSLQYNGPRFPFDADNLQSVRKSPDIVREKIRKELAEGRIAGPFIGRPFPTLRISPLGLVPKKDGDFRVIHHLSYPTEFSVNDFISKDQCSVQYSSIDDAVEMIQALGNSAELGKCDIKRAFRNLPICPGDFDLLGFKFDDLIYYDKCLPMGASISCSLFEKFATFIQWVIKYESPGNPGVIHYLDDFLFVGRAGTEECSQAMKTFKNVSNFIRFPLADDKTEGPHTRLTFLGIELDTKQMCMRLPMPKVKELQENIVYLLGKKKVTLKEMQSLIGSLNFACRVVRPGRAFSRRLIDSTSNLTKPHHRIRITQAIRDDLKVWLDFLNTFNGVTMIHDRFWESNERLELYTDASGGNGFGIYFNGNWAHGTWPKQWQDISLTRNITFLELFPVVVALYIWGHVLENKRLLFHVDNEAVVYIINKQTSKDPRVMRLLRNLVLLTLKFNIIFKAVHIEGRNNSVADAISRCQWSRFKELAPYAHPVPVRIPQEVWQW